jgi:hypothetical protein
MKLEPMKPAPPVTMIFTSGSLRAIKQVGQCYRTGPLAPTLDVRRSAGRADCLARAGDRVGSLRRRLSVIRPW